MGIAERKLRQREEVKINILQSAWKLVNQDGWQSLSIRKIADAIEYSVPVIYDHFENKEAILSEFTRQGFQLLGDSLTAAKSEHTSSSGQLEAEAYAYWQFAFSNKEYYQLMFGLGMPGCDSAQKMPELRVFTEVLLSTIQALISESNNKSIDAFLKFHSFWSMLHGLVSINLMGQSFTPHGTDKDELDKMVLNDFIKGFIKGIQE